jgi:hypothetical protein
MQSYNVVIHCLFFISLAACSLDSPKYSANNPQSNNTQRAVFQPVLMTLDGQQGGVQGFFKCFYTPLAQYTGEHLSVSIRSDSCPKKIKYDFTTTTWQRSK